jgi:hypothetical protein
MPLPTALKKWISDCKAYAAKHNCSYKQAMSALKKLKKSRKSYNGGGAGLSDLNGSPLTETFTGKESNAGTMNPVANTDGGSPPPHPPPAGGDGSKVVPNADPNITPNQGGGGMSQFEVGNQQKQTGGRRRRRRGSKSKRRGQSQSQSGGKRRKSRRGRRRSSRGGSLSYSQY